MVRSSVSLVSAVAVLLTAAEADARVVVAPDPISPSGRVVQDIDVAVGGDRTAVLMDTYVQSGTQDIRDFAVFARVGTGARPGQLQRLPGGGGSAGGMGVAVGEDGTAVAAWVDDKGRRLSLLKVAIATPGRSFAAPQTLARATTRFSHQLAGVAVTPTGRAVVAWLGPEDAEGGVRAAIREPGKRFGPAIELDPARREQPVVAATPSGQVLVSWSTFTPPPTEPAVLARTLSPGSTRFGAPVTLTRPPAVVPNRLAPVDGTGGGGVTWRQRATSSAGAPTERWFSTLSRGGRFATEKLPFSISELSTGLDTLQLVIPSTGRVVAAWADMTERGTTRRITSSVISTSTRPPGRTTFSSARRLSASGWTASAPALGALGSGTVATWAERRQGTSRVRVAERPDRGGWTTPQSIKGARGSGVTAAGSKRRVAIAWVQQAASGRPGAVRLAWVTR